MRSVLDTAAGRYRTLIAVLLFQRPSDLRGRWVWYGETWTSAR